MSLLSTRTLAAATLAIAGMVACSRTPDQPKLPLAQTPSASPAQTPRDALSDAARAALDLGNTEYRAGRFDQALVAYRDAVKAAPDNAAPYFGIYMTAKKLGNAALADSASGEIASRNGANPMLSDSAMRAIHAAKPQG